MHSRLSISLLLLIILIFPSLALPFSGSTSANRLLHKCIAPNGTSSFQDTPCAPTSRTVWSRKVVPESLHAATGSQSPSEKRPRKTDVPARSQRSEGDNTARLARNSRAPSDQDRRQARCTAAKAQRETALARIGLKRTFDLLRALDRDVEIACQGV